MIDLLEAEEKSNMFFTPTSVDLLKKVIPHRDYFLRIAQQLDQVMMYTDHHKKQMSISELVNSTYSYQLMNPMTTMLKVPNVTYVVML